MNILEPIIIAKTIDSCLKEMADSLSKRCKLSQDQAMMLIVMRGIEKLSSMAPGNVEELVTTKVRVDLAAMSGDNVAQAIATHVIAMEKFGQENADRQSQKKN